jgi:hypothetical protein
MTAEDPLLQTVEMIVAVIVRREVPEIDIGIKAITKRIPIGVMAKTTVTPITEGYGIPSEIENVVSLANHNTLHLVKNMIIEQGVPVVGIVTKVTETAAVNIETCGITNIIEALNPIEERGLDQIEPVYTPDLRAPIERRGRPLLEPRFGRKWRVARIILCNNLRATGRLVAKIGKKFHNRHFSKHIILRRVAIREIAWWQGAKNYSLLYTNI